MKPIRLMLVDDQAILLDVLQRQFGADSAFRVVGVAQDGASACTLAETAHPHAAVLDVELRQGESGFDLLPRLLALCPDLHVVMLSLHNHPLYAQRALELGAAAYLDKGVSFEKLKITLCACLKNPVVGAAADAPSGSGGGLYNNLTPRELHVVQQVIHGRLTKDIADALGVTLSTVSTYLKRAKEKLGVQTRAELIREAAALGIVSAKEGAFPT